MLAFTYERFHIINVILIFLHKLFSPNLVGGKLCFIVAQSLTLFETVRRLVCQMLLLDQCMVLFLCVHAVTFSKRNILQLMCNLNTVLYILIEISKCRKNTEIVLSTVYLIRQFLIKRKMFNIKSLIG